MQNEIENIQSYLYIMKMRYEHKLEYTFDIDASLFQCKVPKLILQPIVENCFQHGFADMPPIWEINVRLFRDSLNWYIFDNDSETPTENKTGFGLENTILRLYVYYNGKEIFTVQKTDSNNTVITIGGSIE